VNRDRGSASLWLLGVGLAVVLLGVVAATVASAVVARHRAQAAADLGALAGASRAAQGEAVACARAAELVRANRARLVGCRLDGLDLVVTAEVGLARATARAGPVRASPDRTLDLAGAAGDPGRPIWVFDLRRPR
jgi:secretion/DNA translocation related TadE-like protein